MKKNVTINFLLLSLLSWLLVLAACSTTPPVVEFDSSADPNVELSRVGNDINIAIENQVDVLSPSHFVSAVKALDSAKEARANDRKQKEILHHIAVSEAYLKKAKEIALISGQVLPGVVNTRNDALNAKAPELLKKEFEALDKKLIKVTEEIEDNDTSDAIANRQNLEESYSSLELKAVLKSKLGKAKSIRDKAINEGAEELTPNTLASTEKVLKDNENKIVKDRYNSVMLNQAMVEANISANRLLNMVRQAKSSSEQSPEELAAHLERNENRANFAATASSQKLAMTKDKLDRATSSLESRNEQVDELTDKAEKQAKQARMERQYESARNLFSNNEAEVYKQGDSLLLRLKGLSFSVGESTIETKNFPLLAKVQQVIRDSDAESVIVEGHTDSTGSKVINNKLSNDRAMAVKSYLVSNNFSKSDNISAKGYGFSKPIASNKTQLGRTQNRRVDVIISSGEVE